MENVTYLVSKHDDGRKRAENEWTLEWTWVRFNDHCCYGNWRQTLSRVNYQLKDH
jgi:hypothetical protein